MSECCYGYVCWFSIVLACWITQAFLVTVAVFVAMGEYDVVVDVGYVGRAWYLNVRGYQRVMHVTFSAVETATGP